MDLPIIGIIKRDYVDADVYITATMKEVDELMTVRPDIIAIDATTSTRPNGESLEDFSKSKEKNIRINCGWQIVLLLMKCLRLTN